MHAELVLQNVEQELTIPTRTTFNLGVNIIQKDIAIKDSTRTVALVVVLAFQVCVHLISSTPIL